MDELPKTAKQLAAAVGDDDGRGFVRRSGLEKLNLAHV